MDETATTPLHHACFEGDVSACKTLLASVDDPANLMRTKNEFGYSPFHCACAEGHIEVVQALLQHCSFDEQSFLNDKTLDGNTPLHLACLGGHELLARFLLERGAKPMEPNT